MDLTQHREALPVLKALVAELEREPATTPEPQAGTRVLDWAGLPPEEKLRIVKVMGFTGLANPHTADCPAGYGSGYLCQCVPEPTLYQPPQDVLEYLGETWEDRLAKARERDQERHAREGAV